MDDHTRRPSVDMTGHERHTSCTTAGPIFYWTKDGGVVRVEPMKFQPEEVDSWEVTKNGHTYRPPLKHPLLPWGLAAKQFMYSPNRVKYPLKRVDWDPEGERNTQNRGVSGYERISWDDAFELISKELIRIWGDYGTGSVAWSQSAHPEWGQFHYYFSDTYRFFDMFGGTHMEYSPISWEGWSVGATFLYGCWAAHGIMPAPNTLQDISLHSETVVLWGCNPIFKNVYTGIDTARVFQYWKDLGKRIIVIDPLDNDTSIAYAHKWIPIIPGTDGALACAIAYVWITEGTYDKTYLDTHAVGFDEDHMPEGAPAGLSFKSYILGEWEDGIAKTPEWAEGKCGVPARTIRDLARLWAAAPTGLFAMLGGLCRREFAHEPTRLIVILQAMQGLGKPGVCLVGDLCSMSGPYDGENQVGPTGYADGGMNNVLKYHKNSHPLQKMTYHTFTKCIESPPQKWYSGQIDVRSPQEYFQEYSYPAAGCNEMRMLWQRGSSLVNEPNIKRTYNTYKNSKIETFVVSAPWFDRSCRYADIVLPTTTMFERQDLTEPAAVGRFVPSNYVLLRSAVFHQQAVEPLEESKTDMDIFDELSRRLGFGDAYMEGKTDDDILRAQYEFTNIPLSYDEFKERGYYVWPKPGGKDGYRGKKQLADFYEDPEAHPLDTPTGKLEIFSTILYEHYGINEEIPPVPHYIPEREGFENVEMREDYPLQVTMAHPNFRFHGKFNDCTWLMENYKIKGPDGYSYEPLWMNPADAAKRGLEDGDIVKVFNGRGEILAGLKVTQRIIEGTVWMTYGSWHDPLSEGAEFIDRGGDGNVITNDGPMSAHHLGGAYNSTLVEVGKADLEELKRLYPEGFAGKYSSWNWRAE